MLVCIIVVIILIIIAVTCDFTAYTLTDNEISLLYSDEHNEDQDDSIFGTSTLTGDIAEENLVSEDTMKQAEDLINQIYNG